MHEPRPSLLVFTLGPEAEHRRRRLLPAALGELEVSLRRTCLDAALTAGRACGCRLIVSSPAPLPLPADVVCAPQRGRGFGGRLTAAVAGAEHRGGPLLVVGTDVPGLTADHLERALERLDGDSARVVLGPSPDGGIYLLAATRPVASLLAKVRWCRRDTAAELAAVLSAAGFSVELLEPLADLDRPRDLERWLAGRAGALPRWSLLALLERALAALRRPLAPPPLPLPIPATLPARRGRAPPARPR